jgi:hypothetical protein
MRAHLPILPILIPLPPPCCRWPGARLAWQRAIGLAATVLLLLASALADRALRRRPAACLRAWRLAGTLWHRPRRRSPGSDDDPPLRHPRLATLLYASAGFDERGQHFHPLFQLQLVGLCGAFLTGDLFNLFVFFEVMLLASYTLLAHGGGLARTRAGISYVVLNLIGSALFLIALGLLYGTLGTLNLADMASRLTQPGHDAALARLAFALLIAVFALKAGLLPLSFWLPPTYSAAGAPVAALFAIMTKVGIVAILRVQAVALAPAMPDLLDRLADDPGAGDGRLRCARRAHCRPPAGTGRLAGAALGRQPAAGAGRTGDEHGSSLRRSTTCCNRPSPAPPSSSLAGLITPSAAAPATTSAPAHRNGPLGAAGFPRRAPPPLPACRRSPVSSAS